MSSETINFLDCTFYKGERFKKSGMLDVQPFFKPTNSFMYLHYRSAHPKSIFSAIAKGELVRVLRACSDEETFQKTTVDLIRSFRQRCYPKTLLEEVRSQVSFCLIGKPHPSISRLGKPNPSICSRDQPHPLLCRTGKPRPWNKKREFQN